MGEVISFCFGFISDVSLRFRTKCLDTSKDTEGKMCMKGSGQGSSQGSRQGSAGATSPAEA